MNPIVAMDHISFQYSDGLQVLQDVSLRILPGEKVALLGPNGAGKSTLLLHLNGILTGQGLIKIENLEVKHKNLKVIRALVGLIFQNPDDQLFSPTVYEDVAYGPYYQGLLRQEIDLRVQEALAAVHMEAFIRRNPYHLSSGEKKRVAIATVLSMKPHLLIFDEPTAGLDPRARREFIELLIELPQAMLIATHDLDFALKTTNRSLVLDHGRIVGDGNTRDILEDQDFLFHHGLS